MPEPQEPPPAPAPALTPTPTLDFAPTPSPLTTMKNMPLLDPTVIRELYAAAVSTGLVGARVALLSGIDRGFVAGLPTAPSPAAQLLVDLNELNDLGALDDGTVPLHTWLAGAAQLAGVRREAALFKHHRDRLAPAAPPRTTASAQEPRLDASTEHQLFDALSVLLPAQLDTLLFKLDIPLGILSGPTAPPATRSIEVLRWAKQANRLDDVERLLQPFQGQQNAGEGRVFRG